MTRRALFRTLAALVGLRYVPAPAHLPPLTFKGHPIVWDDLTRSTFPWWRAQEPRGGSAYTQERLMEAMRRLHGE